ncbi:metal ABC transporter solute-binding protein, Zn/Mn family [Pseudodesulfovibrio sp.]|uniref:metal ABC transporter solute-binding protein, Zn/Mn family n=1 Tax=unclassified Pseudodesulfovibrio TaxID=2661612 RepID=UPI003AFF7FBF
MRSHAFFRAFVLILGLMLFTVGSALAAAKVPVFVSIVPQKYFLEKIGGDRVDVSVMVKPGASPATYEPTPQQMTGLANAKAYFSIGVPFEATWLTRIESANPLMAVVPTEKGIHKVPMAAHHHPGEEGHGMAEDPGHGHDEEHGNGILDPHIWLSPQLVKVMAQNIYKGLVAVDPAGQPTYAVNLNAFLEELDALDAQLKNVLASLPSDRRTFMVFHPAWGYFARSYDLRQIPIEAEGKEPSPAELAHVVEVGRAHHIPVVFVQPQFSKRSAKVIASEMGAQVVALDPLAPDWQANLLKVADAFKKALQ